MTAFPPSWHMTAQVATSQSHLESGREVESQHCVDIPSSTRQRLCLVSDAAVPQHVPT